MLDNTSWNPDYTGVLATRQRLVLRMRAAAHVAVGAREYYRTRPTEFINHWVDTYDPRNAGGHEDKLVRMPLVLFRRQEQLVEFFHSLMLADANGLVEKSRDMGATWVACGFSVWAWLFLPGAAVGWGSRKQDLVDRLGDPDSIFEKMRMILRGLPSELLPRGFSEDQHCNLMRIVNPETDATITGEVGDNIGRGGRKRIYFKDESAHYERPEMIEAALMDNTRVQVDISSVNGLGNVFHRRREGATDWEPGTGMQRGRTYAFVMDWRDNPLKSMEWYDERRSKAQDEGLLAKFYQEVDRNYASSVEGIVIQPEWVEAAIDAHLKLHFGADGGWAAGLDVADGGGDTNALAARKGVVLQLLNEWGERDVGTTARRALQQLRDLPNVDLQYDCVGVGAGVKAEANRLADENLTPRGLRFVPWSAAAAVLHPDDHVIPEDRKSPVNCDFYANLKAQAWWQLARRFERTWRAVRKGEGDPDQQNFTYDLDDLISLPSTLPLIRKLQKELSQATMSLNSKLKLVVDKTPEGTRSPNLADSVVMAYWPAQQRKRIQVASDGPLLRAGMRV